MNINTISIIGLGLIGGSLAKSFRKYNICNEIFAIDKCEESLNLALNEKIIDKGFSEILDEVYKSDVIFICTPVKECLEVLKSLDGKLQKNCIVTDVASTKKEIIDSISNLVNPPIFVGGHPMAGKEKSGYIASSKELYNDAVYLIIPSLTSTDEAIKTIWNIVERISAQPMIIEANQHDFLLCAPSHIPHIMASSLVRLLKQVYETNDIAFSLIGGGFIDITRIASSSPVMWEQILLSNKENIIYHLDKLNEMILSLKNDIMSNDNTKINQFFEEAKKFRDKIIFEKQNVK